jgi:Protein of unknown function (DUF2854)
MFRRISLGKLGLTVGGILTVVGFVAYFVENATLNLVGFFYGIPILLGGLALTASELKPVPCPQPSPLVLALREQQATATQNQIRQDVTRYRYGQRAHLDSSLSHLGLSPSDEERPLLTAVRETEVEGAYALILDFESPLIDFATWQKKQDKMTQFFGPGLRVDLKQLAEEEIELALISTPEAVSPEAASSPKS